MMHRLVVLRYGYRYGQFSGGIRRTLASGQKPNDKLVDELLLHPEQTDKPTGLQALLSQFIPKKQDVQHGHSHHSPDDHGHSHSHGDAHGHSHDGAHGHSHDHGNDNSQVEDDEDEYVEMWNENAPAGREWGGPRGLEPTRYGNEWEKKGRVSDFS